MGNDETTIILPIAIAGIGISFSFLWFGDINIIWNMVFVSVPLFCLIIICSSVSAHEKSAYLNGWMVALSDAINQLIGLENDCMLNYNFNSYENTIDFIEKVRDHSSKKRTDVSYLPYIETMLANLLPTAIALIIYCLYRFKNNECYINILVIGIYVICFIIQFIYCHKFKFDFINITSDSKKFFEDYYKLLIELFDQT